MEHKQKILKSFIIVLIIGDLAFSFLQFYYSPLYGDFENGVLPSKVVQDIIDDPLGINTIVNGYHHPNPNRFFSHYAFMKYFQHVPIFLQQLVKPITSVYLSCAIVKIIVQIAFIFFLSFFISGTKKVFKKEFLIAAVLIIPLFQVYGYWSRMGIVDKSVVYTFFYGLPLTLLIIFYIPIFKTLLNNFKIKPLTYFFLFPLSVILPLSGPLIPGVIITINLLILTGIIKNLRSKKNLTIKNLFNSFPLPTTSLLIFVSFFSLYSLLLGKYDTNYLSESVPLFDRYLKLPEGLYSQIFHSLGFPLMLVLIGVNTYFLKRKIKNPESQKVLTVLKWIGYFSLVYILLLPLGGYRPYRPEIIRYDTFMPVSAAVIFFFGYSTYFILKHYKSNRKIYYDIAIIFSLLIFTFSDTAGINKNACEKKALVTIANSPDKIVKVKTDCNVFSWSFISDYKLTELKGELLYQWNITNEKKLFYLEKE